MTYMCWWWDVKPYSINESIVKYRMQPAYDGMHASLALDQKKPNTNNTFTTISFSINEFISNIRHLQQLLLGPSKVFKVIIQVIERALCACTCRRTLVSSKSDAN